METINRNMVYGIMDAIIRYSCNMYNETQCRHAILDATNGDKAIAGSFESMLHKIYEEEHREIPSAMTFDFAEDTATFTRIGRKLCEVFNANNYYYGGNVYNADIDAGAHVWVKPETNVKGTPSLRFTEELDLFKYFVQKAEV